MNTIQAITLIQRAARKRARRLGPGQFCTVRKAAWYRKAGYVCVPDGERARLRPR